jgi:DNA-binding response OmpR family regulator
MEFSIQNIRILVIEDDLAVARSLHDGLVKEGYVVQTCDSGTKGMETAQQTQPHLIILDIRLPDGLGFDFCRKCVAPGFTSLFWS